MEVEGAVEQPGAGDAGAVLARGPLRGLDDLGVVREAQVVVRPEVDVLVALDREPGPRRALDRLVVRPVARRLGQSVVGEARECLEPPLEEAHPALTPPGSSLGSLPPAHLGPDIRQSLPVGTGVYGEPHEPRRTSARRAGRSVGGQMPDADRVLQELLARAAGRTRRPGRPRSARRRSSGAPSCGAGRGRSWGSRARRWAGRARRRRRSCRTRRGGASPRPGRCSRGWRRRRWRRAGRRR